MIKKLIQKVIEVTKSPIVGEDNTNYDQWIEDEIECAIDDDVVDCTELQEPYIGVPAPEYLSEDPWFAPPVLSDKQMTIKEAHEQAIADNQILADESEGVVESSDIHQKMYEIATQGSATTLQLDPPGGSENFQSGPGGWNSGTGLRQFH